jgi:hypothetical protein
VYAREQREPCRVIDVGCDVRDASWTRQVRNTVDVDVDVEETGDRMTGVS